MRSRRSDAGWLAPPVLHNHIFALIAIVFLLAIPLAFLLAGRGIQPAEAPAARPEPGGGAASGTRPEAEPPAPAMAAPETSPEEGLVPALASEPS